VVSPDDVVWHAERTEELGRQLVTLGSSREELAVGLRVVVAVLTLAEVAEADKGHIAVGGLALLEDRLEVRPADRVVLHFAGVDVKVADDAHDVLVGGIQLGGRADRSTCCRGRRREAGGGADRGEGEC